MLHTVQRSRNCFSVESQHGKHTLSVAQIHLDRLGQIESVVLMRQLLNRHERRLVLQMAAAHLCTYYVARLDCELVEPLPLPTPRLPDATESHRLLSFGDTPDVISQMHVLELQTTLSRAGIELIEADHYTVETALVAIANHPRFTSQYIRLEITQSDRRPFWRDTLMVEVSLPGPSSFTFWRELHGRTPPPEIRGLRRTFLIDSETDMLLDQVRPPVVAVHPPRTDENETRFCDSLLSSCVEGCRIELEIDPARILSNEAVDFTSSLLACAMGQDNRYVSYTPR